MKLMSVWKSKVEARHVYIAIVSFLYLYLVGKCFGQYIWGKGIEGCKLELLLITFISFIVYLLTFIKWDFFVKNLKSKKKESVPFTRKNCIYESVFFALIITTFIYLLISYEVIYIDFYRMIPNQEFLSIIGLAFLLFLIFFLIVYFVTLKISKVILATK